MDFKFFDGGNLNISEQLNKEIPIEKWSLLQPGKNDFNFGKKRKIEGNERVLDWIQSSKRHFSRNECKNQQINGINREFSIPRPIKNRKHLLPYQRTPPVRVDGSCFNLPKSLFSGAMLGITPQKMPKNNETTIGSNFFPQITSTPLPCDDSLSANILRNPSDFGSAKSLPIISYGKYVSLIQGLLKANVRKLFPNNTTENILFRLKAAHKSQDSAPQSDRELIRIEEEDVLSQKRAKIIFLKGGNKRKLEDSCPTFTVMGEDHQQQNHEFSNYTGIFKRSKPISPDFTLSPFWLQQVRNISVPDPNSPLFNQLNEHLEKDLNISFLDGNPKLKEILTNFTKSLKSKNSYKDQHFHLDCEKVETFSSLSKEKTNCEHFAMNNTFFQNPDREIFKPPSQKDFNCASKNNMKRREVPQFVLEETNQSWKRSLLDESLQTNSSAILRAFEHFLNIKSPDVKRITFNTIQKYKGD